MIEVQTTRFGRLRVEEDRIIHFPEGLLGFSKLKRYILLDYKDTSVKWLQAVDDPDVAFIVINVFELEPEYELKVPDSVQRLLGIERAEDAVVLVILRVEEGKLIANLAGPLLINSKNRKGIQMVVENASPKVYNMH